MGVILISKITGPVGITVFHIQENLNMGNIQEMIQAAQSAFDDGNRKIILDFEKVQFISSAGIRGLMEIYHIFNKSDLISDSGQILLQAGQDINKGNLWLCNCSSMIFKTLNIAAVTDEIPISTSLGEAIQIITT